MSVDKPDVKASVDLDSLDAATPARPKLKWSVLIPFSAVLCLTIALFTYITYSQHQLELAHQALRVSSSTQYLYQKGINDHAEILAATIESIVHEEAIEAALISRDRHRLQALSQEHFTHLQGKHGISHLYYSDAERINLLRVHKPDRFGDRIDRFTMLEAERTGMESFGMEIGPLGTFTLRFVHPWYVEEAGHSKLIGYVEVGMEVEHLFDEVEDMMDVAVVVLLEKALLQQQEWEQGVRMLGGVPDWQRFPALVTTLFRHEKVASHMLEQFAARGEEVILKPFDMNSGDASFRVVPVSIADVRNNHVGYAIAYMDITDQSLAARKQLLLALAIAIAVGITLFAFFYKLLDRTEQSLLRADCKLRELATHDGLTGLLNHRMFQMRLEGESQRASRYGKPLSLLMIDVDHFKAVNDNYGHHVGDLVLKRISKLITDQCRNIDTICRYGGEEIAVLLPETPLNEGVLAAERIRMHIAADEYKASENETLKVTVSIGVAAFPSHTVTATELAHNADKALYEAKEAGRNRDVAAS